MKISKENSDNRGSMKKLFFRALYLFIGSAFMLSGGYFLYVYWMSPFRELEFMLIGVIFMASGLWIVYHLAYKPRDKMEISTKIAIIVIVIAWFAIINYYIFFPNFLLPPPKDAIYLSVFEIDYEPERYFVLDEEMVTYPLFRLALDNLEVERMGFGSIEITLEEMKIIYNKIEKVHTVYFKYESKFYSVSVSWFRGCAVIPVIR